MKSLKYILAACALLVGVHHVSAVPITGKVDFGGSVTLDGTPATATQVTTWNSSFVVDSTGTFALEGFDFPDPVTIDDPWSFNSGSILSFWAGGGFSFDLTASSIQSQGAGGVIVTGTGTIKHGSYDDTPGTWFFSTQGATGTKFSFSSTTEVPDGGATAMLLGLGLLGMAGVRRKLI